MQFRTIDPYRSPKIKTNWPSKTAQVYNTNLKQQIIKRQKIASRPQERIRLDQYGKPISPSNGSRSREPLSL